MDESILDIKPSNELGNVGEEDNDDNSEYDVGEDDNDDNDEVSIERPFFFFFYLGYEIF